MITARLTWVLAVAGLTNGCGRSVAGERPVRVRRELGRRTLALAQRGLLQIDDPQRAALLLMLSRRRIGGTSMTTAPTGATPWPGWRTAFRALLHGYGV